MSLLSLHRPPLTSGEIDANRRWLLEVITEVTAKVIALSVTGSFLYAAIKQIDSPALTNVAILIIGYFFGSAAKTVGNFTRRQHRAGDGPGVTLPGPGSAVSADEAAVSADPAVVLDPR
jgi:hypothetical protein